MISVINMIPRSLSGESNQDSEPNLALNPTNRQHLVATAFTPDPSGSDSAPLYVSTDGGKSWSLEALLPAASGEATEDITVRFGRSGLLYPAFIRSDNSKFELRELSDPAGAGIVVELVVEGRSNVDQPFAEALQAGSGSDRVYVGNNDLGVATGNKGTGMTATVDALVFQASGMVAAGLISNRIEVRSTGSAGQNGPSVRTATHSDGTVYAAFYGWRSSASAGNNAFNIVSDVVVVRDDDGGTDSPAFAALTDAADGLAGVRVVSGVSINFSVQGGPGQERVGSALSIAVDPRDSQTVYLCWGDLQNGVWTLHLRNSTDGGKTWSNDLLTLPNATNPSLAVTDVGRVGLLYQQLSGAGDKQRWVTHVRRGTNLVDWEDFVLASTLASQPAKKFDPYLGDYAQLLSDGTDLIGVFCASNYPDAVNFPSGVHYQRNADFQAHKLLALDNSTEVPISIDPFFFRITEAPLGMSVQMNVDNCGFGAPVGGVAHFCATVTNTPFGTVPQITWTVSGGGDPIETVGDCIEVQLHADGAPVTVTATATDAGYSVSATRTYQPLEAGLQAQLGRLCRIIHDVKFNPFVDPLWDPLRDLIVRSVEQGDFAAAQEAAHLLGDLAQVLSEISGQLGRIVG